MTRETASEIALINDGDVMWLLDHAGRIIAVTLEGERIEGEVRVPELVTGLCWDGEALWLGFYMEPILYELIVREMKSQQSDMQMTINKVHSELPGMDKTYGAHQQILANTFRSHLRERFCEESVRIMSRDQNVHAMFMLRITMRDICGFSVIIHRVIIN